MKSLGQKIWISNAGFSEVFIVFARIENDKNITGFVLKNQNLTALPRRRRKKTWA